MTLIRLSGATKIFDATAKDAEPVRAVDDVSLDVAAGEICGIIGYSGAGKSTVLRLVNALELPTSGSVEIDGVDITRLGERELRRLRGDIGMIFQQFNLFESRTVAGNVAYPLEVAGAPRAEIRTRVAELLEFVGLTGKATSYPEQLSGGQKQRVGIARALATSPRILLADEATSALDPDTTQEVLALLKRVNTELGVTILVITHEMDVIRTIADRVVVMEHGRIIEQGTVFDILSAPQHAATARFVASIIEDVPTGDDLDALRARHPGRIVTLDVREGAAAQGDVFAALAAHGVRFEVVHGGINDIRGRVFGHLTLALTGEKDAVERAIAAASAFATLIEEDARG
ncbi:MAG: methionine ABC transporter ATP-binding protein [Microbacterium sp. SCN 70-200]|uniref:methionine ABC transporter ATP-binding protein n=1 Tax=unclassified Microbacterium TaxID=2609290 RepID=UPI00086B1A57|nr:MULTISPECIES: methionine ABC transporter ATP-binding protein [unclassified Microbacterium]MBN9213596.1 methionine ABC transporter ATP-binding protein [Microbacterium sp.]ODT42252.1 MAG: methionine ABC transporter ATP-binding protein [Microbacterium sp. SCN 70-200]OJV79119.1 MAG: methionine ABC transporter ATP-binding protein [Microbacterium sp. 70-16]